LDCSRNIGINKNEDVQIVIVLVPLYGLEAWLPAQREENCLRICDEKSVEKDILM
jgi:hypothetical protein